MGLLFPLTTHICFGSDAAYYYYRKCSIMFVPCERKGRERSLAVHQAAANRLDGFVWFCHGFLF